MPDTPYMPIPAHVYRIACDLVTTKRDDESPVVIRVEDIPADFHYSCAEDEARGVFTSTAYPVTFEARYQARDEWSPRIPGGQRMALTFAGWACLHPVDDDVSQQQIVEGSG